MPRLQSATADDARRTAEQLNDDADVLDKDADAIQANIKTGSKRERRRV